MFSVAPSILSLSWFVTATNKHEHHNCGFVSATLCLPRTATRCKHSVTHRATNQCEHHSQLAVNENVVTCLQLAAVNYNTTSTLFLTYYNQSWRASQLVVNKNASNSISPPKNSSWHGSSRKNCCKSCGLGSRMKVGGSRLLREAPSACRTPGN